MGKDKIIGITRVRNEALLIEDTLKHFSGFLDGIIVWDDCSTDDTVDIIRKLSNKKVLAVIQSMAWLEHREAEETRHRHILLQIAKTYDPGWIFCFDTDERIEGDVCGLVEASDADIDGYRVGLYDAYLTPKHQAPYKPGTALSYLPRLYGPERRDILMLWRNSEKFFYEGSDLREPRHDPKANVVLSSLRCRHFGKGISVEQWEATCNYYAEHFGEPYRSKWAARRGKAIHTESDFGSSLYSWNDVHSGCRIIYP